ncbi:MAG: hypothetical protein ACI4MO_05385 [Christensenellales bacterium]
MKCFMHPDVEAIATCKKCGKAMCANCSAYSNHSGICPQCKMEEYQAELDDINEYRRSTIWGWIGKGIGFVALWAISIWLMAEEESAWLLGVLGTLVFGIWSVVKIPTFINKTKRRTFLIEEIAKISKSLSKGEAVI